MIGFLLVILAMLCTMYHVVVGYLVVVYDHMCMYIL